MLFGTAVGLSMDACAVSASRALCAARPSWRHALVMGLVFGLFQGVMPCLGWLLGAVAHSWISAYDHWIVFIILAAVGGKMIHEAFEDDPVCDDHGWPSAGQVVMLGVATSIDALAVGVGFAAMGVTPLVPAIVIGGVTAVLATTAALGGRMLGARFGHWAEIGGGVMLIAIGVLTLVQHLTGRA